MGRAADHDRRAPTLQPESGIHEGLRRRPSLDKFRLNHSGLNLDRAPICGGRRQLQIPASRNLSAGQLCPPRLSQSGPATLGPEELVTRVRKGRSKLGDEAGEARVRRRPWLVRGQQYLRLQRHCRSRGRMRRTQQRREHADQETERAAPQQPERIESSGCQADLLSRRVRTVLVREPR